MNKQIVDQFGNIVKGLLKSDDGSIVVNNISEYERYKLEKNNYDDINKMKEEMIQLKKIIKTLLEKNNGNSSDNIE